MAEKDTRARPALPADAVAGATGHIAAHNALIDAVEDLRTVQDGKASLVHSHIIANVTGLQTALDTKARVSHNHTTAQVTGLDTVLAGKAPLSHSHNISDVNNLQTSLDGKSPTSHTHAQYLEPSEIIAGTNVTIDRNTTPGSVIISSTGGSGGSGTFDHALLTNRDAASQHPIVSITGLETALDKRAPVMVVASLDEVPPGTPAGTVIVVSASAPPPTGTTPSIVSFTTKGESTGGAVLSKPSGLQVGDWLFMFMGCQGSTAVTGFTAAEGFDQAAWAPPVPAPADVRFNYVAKKRITDLASEPASYSFKALGAGTARTCAIMLVVRGANPTDPVAVYGNPVSRTPSSSPEIPAVTVPDNNCLAIGYIHTVQTTAPDTTHSAPGWTLAVTADHPAGESATSSSDRVSLLTKPVGAGLLPLTTASAAGGTAVAADAGAVVVIRP